MLKDLFTVILFVLVVALIGLIIFCIYRRTKRIQVGALLFISGGVKKFKSGLSVFLALNKYFENVIGYYISYVIKKCIQYITLHKIERLNKHIKELHRPMLYSNMPIRVFRFNRLTKDILLRNVRIPNKSVVLIDEESLVADCMRFNDKEINNDLMLFFKLFGHYSHGGSLIINSQSICDCHYSLKRCISSYIYCYKTFNFPFFVGVQVKELMYSEDNSSININNADIEDKGLRFVLVPKFVGKLYDPYYLSIFTDDNEYYVDYSVKPLTRRDSLKVNELVSFMEFKNLDRRLVKKVENKENEKI